MCQTFDVLFLVLIERSGFSVDSENFNVFSLL